MRSTTSVFVLITSPSGEVIMLDRRDPIILRRTYFPPNLKELPGGAIDERENPKDAAVRETFEETGNLLDRDRLVQIGIFKKDYRQTYFFHYETSQEDFDEIFARTESLLKDFWSNEKKDGTDVYPSAIAEHRGIHRFKIWDVLGLAQDTPVEWTRPEFPETTTGITCRYILSLHADVVVYWLAKQYHKVIADEMVGREHDIVHDLKGLLSPRMRNIADGCVSLTKKIVANEGKGYNGADNDFQIDEKKRGAAFKYIG